ncbi:MULTISPECIES: sugar ABC transporter ATP-binding protein [Bradyrhizobium]|nr:MULTISPECIES: sugar ABC transporter ATP-binding protein [Bradyrhizobium]MCG2631949.1 sugar ABC transporter ATP-binding protein [Bradyrhizobium zhengyangense]MCG2645004.1 sugar ABC transporter ATP-binding protein [Bradyrhizobium zhengyangense]MCG2672742.1 sugar ABC transporter ATP-binding protein [Bradyrhizobium zhengyangense]MDN4985407.1 sugar ABC transporter ATP-binding protein [Bradyrhizobium sp. WYCCWR 13022]MDN5002362.1 sugar ABC transporter ATP-binding protein [Bradyrhizobium sp. WYCCW
MSERTRALVEFRNITKRFGATQALKGVSFSIMPGETLGLLGANGAGKSTLIKVLSGNFLRTSGEILIEGERTEIRSPTEARDCGIATVHQNIDDAVVFGMTVAENLLLDDLSTADSPFFLNRRSVMDRAQQVQQKLGLKLPLEAPVEELSASGRQEVAIARALVKNPKLLILDEPTSTLSAREAEKLFEAVADLKRRGIAVLYVSHRMSESQQLCNRAVVLRNGQIVSEHQSPLDTNAIATSILGDLILSAKHVIRRSDQVPVFVGRGLRVRPDAVPVDLTFRKGEVIGITGLVGAGKTELLEQIYGAMPLVSGKMLLNDRPFKPRDAADALTRGVAMVPEERAKQSIFPGEGLAKHCSIGAMGFFSRYGFIDLHKEVAFTQDIIRDYNVKCPGWDAPIEALSGGNQQKLLVGRWLKHGWSLLILDEPFRGIDIGARGIISDALRAFSEYNSVVVSSSDPEEVVEVADRVLIMVEGAIAGEVMADALSSEELSEIMSRTGAARQGVSGGTLQ